MYQKLLYPLTALLLLSGCATKQQQQPSTNTVMIIQPVPKTKVVEQKCHNFPTGKVCATPQLTNIVNDIEALQTSTAHLSLESNQNISIGHFLNIKATSNVDGYLKLLIIDPDSRTYTVLPNASHGGYLKAGKSLYTNNSKFNFRTSEPKGLHYVVAIFTQSRLPLSVQQGNSMRFDATSNHDDLIRVLEQVRGQVYGLSSVKIFPFGVY